MEGVPLELEVVYDTRIVKRLSQVGVARIPFVKIPDVLPVNLPLALRTQAPAAQQVQQQEAARSRRRRRRSYA